MDTLLKRAASLFFSSSSPAFHRNYNVFLSFRGEDTRKSFTDHLYNALKLAGLQVFIDNKGLPRGKEISPGLRKAIQEANVCIVVFSRNYASSKWCLDELLEILECKERLGLIVLPVFYNGLANALMLMLMWQAALREAANISDTVWIMMQMGNTYSTRFFRHNFIVHSIC